MRLVQATLVCSMALVVALASSGPLQSTPQAATVSMLFRSGSTVVDRVLEFEGNLLVLEDNNHRIAVADRQGYVKRQIGSIGQGPGELYYPGDLAQAKNGNLYVLEVRNRRIQIFDPAGRSLRIFPVEAESTGMAVNSKGQVLLGQPATGALVSVYSPDGRRVGAFGDLRLASDFYGEKVVPLNRSMREAINRVHIVCDDADNIYLSFLGAPFWQKYSSDGKLIFEHRIEFPDANRALTEFASTLRAHSTVKFDEDRSAIPYVTTGMTSDGLHRLVLSVRWDRSWIVIANLDGNNGPNTFLLQNPDLQIRSLSADSGSRIFAVGATPGHNNEIYSITLPQAMGISKETRR